MKKLVPSDKEFLRSVEIIHNGGVVAFPTETYYGLAVDPFNDNALQRLFALKGRPELKPVLLLISQLAQLDKVTISVPIVAQKLMNRFWPGPLTLVLPAQKNLSPFITGNTYTVGVRLSPNPAAQQLVNACNIPLTATSANRSGCPPAVSADEVKAMFGDQVDYILDGGRTPGKRGSTLIGFDGESIRCIREGCIDFQVITDYVRKISKS